MASKIIPLIPRHTVYVEPFAGGATILFKKPWPLVTNTHHYSEVINDKKEDLINFYRVLRDPVSGPKLCDRIALTLYSRAEHALRRAAPSGDLIERAAIFYCDNQMSFSGEQGRGWGTCVFGRNIGATWANKVAKLPDYISRMAAVHVECSDALEVIKRWDSPQTFFYCDPPYPGTDQGHYKGYTTEDFQNLVATLDAAQGSFLLSNYDQPDMPEEWERFEFSARNSSTKKGSRETRGTKAVLENTKRTEIVWRRFNRVPVRPEIQKLYDAGKFDCFVNGEYLCR